MKTLIALTLTVLSLNAFATSVFTLNHGSKRTITFECVEKDAKQECQKYSAIEKTIYENGQDYSVVIGQTVHKEDLKEIAENANHIMGKLINRGYIAAALIGTELGLVSTQTTSAPVAVGLLILGVSADIVKAPAVGVAYVGSEAAHGIFGKMKMNKLIKFLADENSSEEARITKGHYKAVLCAIENDMECSGN